MQLIHYTISHNTIPGDSKVPDYSELLQVTSCAHATVSNTVPEYQVMLWIGVRFTIDVYRLQLNKKIYFSSLQWLFSFSLGMSIPAELF